MRPTPLAAALLAVAVACVAYSAPPPLPADLSNLERLPLFDPAELKIWTTAESSVQASTDRTRGTTPALHWHVTVDFNAGEPKYPIGWPRVLRNFPAGPLRDWSGWDYLHGWVYVATNREKLPGVPAGLGLHTPDRAGAYQRTLSELRANAWAEIRIPISQIPRAHDVRQIQFHIAEQNYRHGDQLDFYFSDLALFRHIAPKLLEFSPESSVLFSSVRDLSLRVQLTGSAPGQPVEISCALHAGERLIARESLRASRGVQVIAFELGSRNLPPGEYELRANLGRGTSPAIARFRLVESPWK